MSVTHMWLFFRVPAAHKVAVSSVFESILTEPVAPEYVAAFEAWGKDPVVIERRDVSQGSEISAEDHRTWWEFEGAFGGTDAAEATSRLEDAGSPLGELYIEHDFVIPKANPVLLLFCALGPGRALALPGTRGFMLLPASKVGEALERMRPVFSGLDRRELRARANRATGKVSGLDVEPFDRLVDALPAALEVCQREGHGFMALPMWT